MRALLLLLIMCVPLAAQENAPAGAVSLPDAIALALEHNREALASREAVKSAEYGVKSSYGKFLPQLSVEGKYTRLNDDIEIDLKDIRTAMIAADVATLQASGITNPLVLNAFRGTLNASLPPFVSRVQKNEYYNLSAGLVQPLFTGGKLLANTRLKKAELETSREQDRQVRNKIIAETVTAYCRLQLAGDLVKIRRGALEDIRGHQANAAKLHEQGIISRANKMRADVAMAEAQREYAKSLRDRELAAILFSNALGTEYDGSALSSPLFLSGTVKPLAAYTGAGLAENPNLRILRHKETQITQKYRAALSGFMPTVSLFGKYELYKEDLTILEPEWAGGILARISLFNGGSDVYDTKAAAREIEMVKHYAARARELVNTEITKQYIDLQSAREQFESLENSRDLAEENLRLNRLSFTEGMATSLEVIDAELSLERVRMEQSKALYDFDVALVNLLAASGDAGEITNYRTTLRRNP